MMMLEMKTTKFLEELSSKAPVPGGGGASAAVGAFGAALGMMVANLTVGKKKYADVEEELRGLMEQVTSIQNRFLQLIDEDAQGFAPLAKAYGLPSGTEEEKAEKARVMEKCLNEACGVPLEIMENCCRAIDLIEVFAAKGSVLAVSDAGVAAACCRAALKGASLNIYINTKSMKDRSRAEELNQKCDEMIAVYGAKAEKLFDSVLQKLK